MFGSSATSVEWNGQLSEMPNHLALRRVGETRSDDCKLMKDSSVSSVNVADRLGAFV